VNLQPWVSEGSRGPNPLYLGIWYFAIKLLVEECFSLRFGVGKLKFHHCWPPLEKSFWPPPGKFHYCPPWKKIFAAPFEKNLPSFYVCIQKKFRRLRSIPHTWGGNSGFYLVQELIAIIACAKRFYSPHSAAQSTATNSPFMGKSAPLCFKWFHQNFIFQFVFAVIRIISFLRFSFFAETTANTSRVSQECRWNFVTRFQST